MMLAPSRHLPWGGDAFGEAHATIVGSANEGTYSESRRFLCRISVGLDQNSDEECVVQQATVVETE